MTETKCGKFMNQMYSSEYDTRSRERERDASYNMKLLQTPEKFTVFAFSSPFLICNIQWKEKEINKEFWHDIAKMFTINSSVLGVREYCSQDWGQGAVTKKRSGSEASGLCLVKCCKDCH